MPTSAAPQIPAPPETYYVEVPYEAVELLAAYRWKRDCVDIPWAELDELTRQRREKNARDDLEDMWPALEVYFREGGSSDGKA